MALQDLTPQLRTRLSRMERTVGWFVLLAVALLAFGFIYYVYNTAERKGWFKTKAPFFTFADTATGLKVGDPITLMGRNVGQITEIQPMDPDSPYNIYVEFQLISPYYGYIWSKGSRARVAVADLLGKRSLEVTKGTSGYPVYLFHPLLEYSISDARALSSPEKYQMAEEVYDSSSTNLIIPALKPLDAPLLQLLSASTLKTIRVFDTRQTRKYMTGIWNYKEARYEPYAATTKPFWLEADESPAVTERLEKLLSQVEVALPNILSLTNQLAALLNNGAGVTSNLNDILVNARPAVSNIAAATSQLNRPGGLGDWLLPTNISQHLDETLTNANTTLGSANTTLNSANTNLIMLAQSLDRSLENLASLTSNLNQQVEVNSNILSSISKTVVDADTFVQGLKRHWLLRSAFKTKETNAPPQQVPSKTTKSPKAKSN
jgi:ABC-type transporter Mla subunit MlaD